MPTFMTTTMRFSGDAFAGAPPLSSAPVKPERMKHELLHEAMTAKPRLLLISKALPEHWVLVDAAKSPTKVIEVDYENWTLADLRHEIAGLPAHTFSSVGVLDHGAPGEFKLLKSLKGAGTGKR